MTQTSHVACVPVDHSVHLELGGLSRYSDALLFPARGTTVLHGSQTRAGAHPASCPMDTEGDILGLKWPVREADHSPPSNAEVDWWRCTSTPLCPLCLHSVVLN
jgi:hypothetical protein